MNSTPDFRNITGTEPALSIELEEGRLDPSSEPTVAAAVAAATVDDTPVRQQQHRALDVVIAHYDPAVEQAENLLRLIEVPTIMEKNPRWIMYNKNEGKRPILLDKMKFDEVIDLPNIGREGQTYLHHMISRNDVLADHTLFCQDAPHNMDRVVMRLGNLFTNRTGFLSLSLEQMCPCGGCPCPLDHITEFYAMVSNSICIGDFMAAMTGCFVVSRRRIQSVRIEKLEYMKEMLEAPLGHFIHQQGYNTESKPSSPAVGHIVERMWSVAFNCHTRDVFDRQDCTSIDCIGPQCLDDDEGNTS